ncbi:MAG: helix-turn-helix transcriptional regulator [Clostridia bacterium]|nr:helix-turn-helix transcriptional regulator [Clostridia bacterium]
MNKTFDISDFVGVPSVESTLVSLTERVRARRKEMKLSQKRLAERSGVSYASLRRFESTGEISLVSLINIAAALGCMQDFEQLFREPKVTSIKDLKL